MATYTVQKGDTLSEIAAKYLGDWTLYKQLASANDISNPDLIYVGQVINLDTSSPASPTKSTSKQATIKQFGLQSNTTSTLFATWAWSKSHTASYHVKWEYCAGGVWFVGTSSSISVDDEDPDASRQSTYNIPDNATSVRFKVKPISEKKTVNDKETVYWTADWSSTKTYNVSDSPPTAPSAPTVTINQYQLTAELDNLDLNASRIQFQVVKDNSTVYSTGIIDITTSYAKYTCTVGAGSEYKVRCRSYRDEMWSDWSEYSSNASTAPASPGAISSLRALSETSVYIAWRAARTATSYEIDYTTNIDYFDSSSETQSMTVESVVTHAEITGLESGEEWFFRVRSVNSQGNSTWTDIQSIKIGTAPSAPTTWSSTTTVVAGEPLTLYWVHNSEDGSSQTYAQLEAIIDGTTSTQTIENTADEDEKDKTSSIPVNTSGCTEGTKILWRVRTRGILDTYSEWSIQRTVDVYAPPTLDLSVTDASGSAFSRLTALPIRVYGVAGPNTQTVTGYHLSIVSNEAYETVDNMGNTKMVSAGEEVYSKHYDISTNLSVKLSAGDVSLENNVSYTINCTVSMNSGLTALASHDFTVSWTSDEYWPNAEIGYNKDTYSTYIRPYCEDEDGIRISNTLLSVYRREFDGSFTELMTGISNDDNTFITDPHPSLDLARYRVVATSKDTGAVCYYDVPGYPIGGKSVIIQWNEKWSNFDTTSEDALEQPAWSGSLLELPYNIDVSDSNSPDVELVKYIGREHPVSYYGTQLGETSTWKVDIAKSDKDTLYALRRLAVWMGDVYVREPSGSGYWAHVKVSFSQTHCEVTIPVTLNITRVAGGV